MSKLPPRARLLVLTVFFLAAVSIAWAAVYDHPRPLCPNWELVLMGLLAVLAGGRKVQVIGRERAEENGSLTLGYAIIVASMLRGGPLAGMIIGCLACLSSCIYPRVQPPFQLSYNLALTALQWWFAGVV